MRTSSSSASPSTAQLNFDVRFSDYFVYRVHSQRPKLDLLPTSAPYYFQGQEIVILSCGDGSYVVASIQPLGKSTFTLHLYRSLPNGEPGTWTSKPVDVEEPLRHKVCPIPSSSGMPFCQETRNVITLGGAKKMGYSEDTRNMCIGVSAAFCTLRCSSENLGQTEVQDANVCDQESRSGNLGETEVQDVNV
ncbi:hypothetical protein D1007_11043 [Hordeum vulgare]|nr:hypothetical protein D1007_11043 [Hordeum vulgare]